MTNKVYNMSHYYNEYESRELYCVNERVKNILDELNAYARSVVRNEGEITFGEMKEHFSGSEDHIKLLNLLYQETLVPYFYTVNKWYDEGFCTYQLKEFFL